VYAAVTKPNEGLKKESTDRPTNILEKAAVSLERLRATLEEGESCWSYGATDFDDKMIPQFNTPEAVEAVDLYKGGPPGELNYGWQDVMTLFPQGLAAMIVDCDFGQHSTKIPPIENQGRGHTME
jgi:hypothetical protein